MAPSESSLSRAAVPALPARATSGTSPKPVSTERLEGPASIADPGSRLGDGETEPAEESFAELLERYSQTLPLEFTPGEVRQGTVVAVEDGRVYVDVGLKREGVLLEQELLEAAHLDKVVPGQQVAVTVTGRTAEGYFRLSAVQSAVPVDWEGLQKAFEEQRVITGTVIAVVKGGFRVDVGAQAFLPNSRSGVRNPEEAPSLVGQQIRCKIIQLDLANEDIVVDRRVVLEEEQRAAREKLFESLQEGAIVQGKVRSITDYGAFVDLGGIDGLLHVSDLSWDRSKKPTDLLREGDMITVKILQIDRERRRVSLGLKQLAPDPWSTVAERYPLGARVRGTVTRLAEFGAFVQLEPGVEGLIHLSDLSWSKKVRKPSDVLQPGEAVEVVVLSVDPQNRRIGLSLKQALGDPWEEVAQKYPAGSVIEGTVTNLANFGAFVEVAEGVEGLIHISDLTSERRVRHPKEVLQPGERVRALVLEIDPGKRRLRLGLKQLEPTPLERYLAAHRVGEVVSGRIVRVEWDAAEVELADGVTVRCPLPEAAPDRVSQPGQPGQDLRSLTALLAAKWKGELPAAEPRSGVRAGQVRSFRITALDASKGVIELELAD